MDVYALCKVEISFFLLLPICIYAFGSACPYTIFRLPDADRLIFLFYCAWYSS